MSCLCEKLGADIPGLSPACIGQLWLFDNLQPPELEALVRSIHSSFESYVKLNKKVPPEVLTNVAQLKTASRLADTISTHLNLKLEDRQKLLELVDPAKRLEEVFGFMQAEIEVLEVLQDVEEIDRTATSHQATPAASTASRMITVRGEAFIRL